jgi:hypothetical protein
MATEKISKSNPVAKDIAKHSVTVQLFGARTTTRKDGTPAANPKIVFALAGAQDVQQATKAGYPIVSIYGDATYFEEGDIIEVTLVPKPKTASK